MLTKEDIDAMTPTTRAAFIGISRTALKEETALVSERRTRLLKQEQDLVEARAFLAFTEERLKETKAQVDLIDREGLK